MANALLSLLDVTKLRGADQEIGLLEDTITYAPELSTVMGRPIVGTQYKTVHRTLPVVGFRQVNTGSFTVKGIYRETLKECFVVDPQMQVDQAVVMAQGHGNGPEAMESDLLIDEAQGVIGATYILIGAQMYYGTSNDSNGFTGINLLTPSSNAAKNNNPAVIKAGGSTANVQSSAYLLWENIRGAHFIFGNNSGFTMLPEWRLQQVQDSSGTGRVYTAYVNNLLGWIGFAVNHQNSVARIANINLGTDSSPLTDKLVAQLLSYLPLQMRQEVIANANTGMPNKWGPGLKMFVNPLVAYSLQQSRSPVSSGTGTAITAAESLKFADLPTASNGVPLVLTDSIVNTEAVIT